VFIGKYGIRNSIDITRGKEFKKIARKMGSPKAISDYLRQHVEGTKKLFKNDALRFSRMYSELVRFYGSYNDIYLNACKISLLSG